MRFQLGRSTGGYPVRERFPPAAAGTLLRPGGLNMTDAMGYVLSLEGVSTVVIGCRTPEEVQENARIAREFRRFDRDHMDALEHFTLGCSGNHSVRTKPECRRW